VLPLISEYNILKIEHHIAISELASEIYIRYGRIKFFVFFNLTSRVFTMISINKYFYSYFLYWQ